MACASLGSRLDDLTFAIYVHATVASLLGLLQMLNLPVRDIGKV